MDAKDTWAVVKFIIAGTGFKRRDARKMLGEIPEEKYSRLFLEARAWEREQAQQAGKTLADLLGESDLETLRLATKMAQTPSGGDDDDDEERPARRAAAPKPRKR